MTTKTTESTMTREALTRLEAAHAAAEREAGRLRTLARGGEVGQWSTRREEQRTLTRAGIQTVEVERPVYETRQVERLERLQAQRALPEAEERVLRAEEALVQAREAFTEAQQQRRRALVDAYDREVADEVRKLVQATDATAALWQRFTERNRARDAEYLATGDLNAFGWAKYADLSFPPLTDTPGEPSQWSLFRARVTETR